MGVSYFLYLSCLGLAITAQDQDCSRPVGGPNTVLTDNRETYPTGTTVTFECETGYITAGGNPRITCTDGTWSPLSLKCERRNCGSAGEVENGQVDYPEGTEFGDKLVVHCNTGFALVGRQEIICGSQGWMDRLPVCEAVTCPKLPTFVNGTFSPVLDVYKYQDVVQYSCLKGYTLNGSKSISCSEKEKFEPSPPTCVKVDCLDPRIPNSEFVQGSRPPHGYKATVTFECKPGYTMEGSDTLTCQINSQWSPGLPKCSK
ncbi:regulator of complement activation group 2 gene 1 isoform X1 [Scomber japonicus]|uniref:regulator of complement activation group 2 gene 1 isoform X1 n=1 Tax=Scomber japonicus TaxID=13676 RepID=UPI0023062E23|nr:regulator of complement activation group 2 gene 1 isoform X1 [Scomber japonicus]